MELTEMHVFCFLFGTFTGFICCLVETATHDLCDFFRDRKLKRRLKGQSLKICPYCSSYVANGHRYCSHCGNLLLDS